MKNQVVSASVIARTCTRADGLATALMVMDIETSLELINRLPRTECLIVKKKGNKLFPYRSEGFKHYER